MPDVISVNWTPFALLRLDEIYDYIADQAKATEPAQKLIDKIFNKTDQLKIFPLSGQEEILLKDKGVDCRYLIVGSYKIIYECVSDKNMVVKLDIFNTSRNPENVLKK